MLLGTIAVETSEYISELLKRAGIKHEVLNAKQHEREAEIIKDAGQLGAVTIATNMAGRGVDIKLGEGVREQGGLYVLGTERHESRRIDNQLRGRSGRQGDPGESRFYLSAQDELVRLFAGDRIFKIIDRFKLPDDQPMEASILSKQIENAQKKVEEQNFVARKNVLKYDDVMNLQRQVIYEQRRRVLEGVDMSAELRDWVTETVDRVVRLHLEEDDPGQWDLDRLINAMQQVYRTTITAEELSEEVELDDQALVDEFAEDALDDYGAKEAALGPELMRELERFVVLQVVDHRWREHLENMEYLREGVHLRAMAQKDPLVEYRGEGHLMFEALTIAIREEVVILVFHAELVAEDAQELQDIQAEQAAESRHLSYEHESLAGADAIAQAMGQGGGAGTMLYDDEPAPVVEQRILDEHDKIGRNDPCWCGSGKKFKKCHGA